MFTLKIIIASTRPGRKGPAIAAWIQDVVNQHPEFAVELLDLAEINLPFMDEPNHPRLQQYEHEHTKNWSRAIDAADAFIIVTPEYNHGFSAPLKNALDFLAREWAYKPVGLVSYGGIAAGTRAVQLLKPVLTALKLVPLAEAVNIPFFARYLDDQEGFVADETLTRSANDMITELLRWTKALKPMRLA
ncbi:NADPH-dependent FMN reductase [Spirosoma sp. SC4-14]|uniref:NADPH-dependent FMN reductase n=1 Tax=Spirosoma sp. SC4-14 TaxID=3128900 RepID=UPI0030D3BBC9